MASKRLDGKVILVTGASRGIGRAVAIEAGRQGEEVILTGRTTGALEEVDDHIHAAGGNSVIVELDQTDFPAIPRLASAIASRWGALMGLWPMPDSWANYHLWPIVKKMYLSAQSL